MDDPIGRALDMRAFHIDQMDTILRSKMIPIDQHPETLPLTRHQTEENLAVMAGRSESEEDKEETVEANKENISEKQPVTQRLIIPWEERDLARTDTDANEGVSVLHRIIVPASPEMIERNRHSDSDIIRQSMDVADVGGEDSDVSVDTIPWDDRMSEFDVESDYDESRPIQAYGGGTESDATVDYERVVNIKDLSITDGTTYSGDEQVQESDGEEQEVIDYASHKDRQCLYCGVSIQNGSVFCNHCWERRRHWVPRRPVNFKNKKRASKKGKCRGEVIDLADDSTKTGKDLCKFCYMEPMNAVFIHGRNSHLVGCYTCSRQWWSKNSTCPVCRRDVLQVIKIIQA